MSDHWGDFGFEKVQIVPTGTKHETGLLFGACFLSFDPEQISQAVSWLRKSNQLNQSFSKSHWASAPICAIISVVCKLGTGVRREIGMSTLKFTIFEKIMFFHEKNILYWHPSGAKSLL